MDIPALLDAHYRRAAFHEWNARRLDHQVMLETIDEFGLTSVLEIGTFRGHTANLLVSAGLRVATLDTLVTRPPGLNARAVYYYAGDFVAEDFDLVFIDDGHAYADVARDYALALLCRPRVILFHDAGLPGPGKFLSDLRSAGHDLVELKGNCLMARELVERSAGLSREAMPKS